MSAAHSDPETAPAAQPIVVFAAMAVVLALRLWQLSSAMLSPLSFQPGPDEDYYLQFGQAVAAGQGQYSAEFTFLDPLYGYLLGALFKLAGVNLFVIFALQVLIDTLTAYGLMRAGRLLGWPKAGFYAALLYGASASAIMYSTTVLKESWATAYLAWWVVGALLLVRSQRKWAWLLFGAYCGLGVALRSNLLLLTAEALTLPYFSTGTLFWRQSAAKSALLACGLMVALLPWSIRNLHAYGSVSPLPHNSGIELHQVYNVGNPGSELWIPEFVNYLEPREIWRGYAAEADLRQGRTLSVSEVDRYWRDQALDYMASNPLRVARDILRKTLNFLSAAEVPDNRSLAEEKLFSPVLRLLPAPTAWLIALGVAGLAWLMRLDRRWPVIAAPIFLAWFTVALFFTQDRFRLLALPMLALCAGIWIDQWTLALRERRTRQAIIFGALAAFLLAVSLLLGARSPAAPVRWDQIAWGYIKMGEIGKASAVAQRIAAEDPQNGAILEALGFTYIARQQYDQAADAYQRAVKLRPRSHIAHFNLARVYFELGDHSKAAAEAKIAVQLNPAPEYRALLSKIESQP